MRLINEFAIVENGEFEGYRGESYCEYFYNEIQIYEDTFTKKNDESIKNGDSYDRHSKGATLEEFANFCRNQQDNNGREFYEELIKIATDKKIKKFQNELFEQGINICMLNTYYLAKYIIYKCRSYSCLKLSPLIEDTLSEISNLKEITFTNKDGTKSTSSNNFLLDIIVKAMKKEKGNDGYEAKFEFIPLEQISNKEILQTYFIHDMALFLNDYFKIERKKGALISTKEQELITYLMYILGLTPSVVSKSRYRQLLGRYEKINTHLTLHHFDLGEGRRFEKHFCLLKYKTWKMGKIDWSSSDLEIGLDEGDSFMFVK